LVVFGLLFFVVTLLRETKGRLKQQNLTCGGKGEFAAAKGGGALGGG
jgi:hypothetical protein